MPHDAAVSLPEQMLRMITGYWVSQVIGTVAKLAVPDLLSSGPKSSAQLAEVTESHPDALYRVLRAAASVGVLSESPRDRFALTPLGETLRSNVPGSMRDMAIMQTAPGHWLPWGRLADVVKSGKPATVEVLGAELFDWYAAHPSDAAAFSGAMSNLSALVAAEVVSVCDFSRAKRIVDVGGAYGTLLAAILKAAPQASGVLFDLPHIVKEAHATLKAQGVAERVELAGGDFFRSVPAGGDVYLLKHILHDWNDEQATTLLRRCAESMATDAVLRIVELVLPEDNSPGIAQLMDINMLALLSGRERTKKDFARLLEGAGLELAQVKPTRSAFYVLEAKRRGS